MNVSTICPVARVLRWSVTAAAAGILLVTAASAQSVPVPAVVPLSVEVPDGAPQLAPEKTISNASATGGTPSSGASGAIVVNEERVQGRLAAAHVSLGGARGYTVVDPDAGRSDRQSGNGGKRLSPSLWELFRF
jgi:hypothetical protein